MTQYVQPPRRQSVLVPDPDARRDPPADAAPEEESEFEKWWNAARQMKAGGEDDAQ